MEMRAVHENIEGPFSIGEDLAVYGHITQGATLREGGKLILHGTIAGDLTVEPGARAIIHGTVAGRIYNKGGRVEIFGMAAAVENLSPDASTIIDGAAHILRGDRKSVV
jgi:cytoskeletal protein CcmA (bactofilin family)